MEAVFHDGVREKDGKAGHNSQQFANAAAEECSGGGHPTIPKPFRSFIAQPSSSAWLAPNQPFVFEKHLKVKSDNIIKPYLSPVRA